MKFNELNLSPEMLKAINDIGYVEATYIQSACIPTILSGGDVIGQSQTGTGKTAAFSIPLLEKIKTSESKRPQALILSPTRELALQVTEEIRKFAKYKEGIKTVCIYGGAPIVKQIQELKKGCDIVVGTPGRVLDHINRKTLKFNDCHTLILDEADEMLNMGFREDIEEVIKSLNEERQTILFSATMPKPILDITHLYQNNPVHIKTPQSEISATTIEQIYYEVNQSDKKVAIMQLVQTLNPGLAMIFCNTKKMVDDLCQDLVSRGYPAAAIHGDMKQEMRLAVLNKFKERKITILIATDVAARGIDVDSMDVVFNYDFPQEDEYYIHRIGRTGRAGKTGLAVTLITPRQRNLIKNIEKKTKAKVEKRELPTGSEMKKIRLGQIKLELEKALVKTVPADICELLNELCQDGFSYQQIAEALTYKLIGSELFEAIKKPKDADKLVVTHKGYTTLQISLGRKNDVQPAHVVGAITEASGINGKDIGKIKVKDTFLTVEVPEQFANQIIDSMSKTTIRGQEFDIILEDKDYQNLNSKNKSRSRNRSSNRDTDITRSDRKKAHDKTYGKNSDNKKSKTNSRKRDTKNKKD